MSDKSKTKNVESLEITEENKLASLSEKLGQTMDNMESQSVSMIDSKSNDDEKLELEILNKKEVDKLRRQNLEEELKSERAHQKEKKKLEVKDLDEKQKESRLHQREINKLERERLRAKYNKERRISYISYYFNLCVCIVSGYMIYIDKYTFITIFMLSFMAILTGDLSKTILPRILKILRKFKNPE